MEVTESGRPCLQALSVDGAQQAGGAVLQQQQDALVAGRHRWYLQVGATGSRKCGASMDCSQTIWDCSQMINC